MYSMASVMGASFLTSQFLTYLSGEYFLRFIHRRDTENGEEAQRVSQIRPPLDFGFDTGFKSTDNAR
jgi:hypothetical protein